MRTLLIALLLCLPSVCFADYNSYQAELDLRRSRARSNAMDRASQRRNRVEYKKNYQYYGPPVYYIYNGGVGGGYNNRYDVQMYVREY